ncbi:MAG: hypothetical protein AAGU11_24125 [Syntrophobacteraceae bacterium]
MTEEKFECVACGENYDRSVAVMECKICHRAHCKECLDKEGLCVPCSEKQ